MISLRIEFDLLAVQGTLKSLLQHHNSKASILQHSAFDIVQISHPYMTTGKTITLTIQTFINKVMSLLFNMLSRFVILFLSRSKGLLISWLQSPSTVILEPKKIKLIIASTLKNDINKIKIDGKKLSRASRICGTTTKDPIFTSWTSKRKRKKTELKKKKKSRK